MSRQTHPVVGLHNLLDLNLNKVVEGVDVLLDQSLDLEVIKSRVDNTKYDDCKTPLECQTDKLIKGLKKLTSHDKLVQQE